MVLTAFINSAPPPPPANNPYVSPVVTASATNIDANWETYTLSVDLLGTATNVYTIYGTAASQLSIPAAYQCATPFGANTGGTNSAFWAVANNGALGYAQYDSWLTVGITGGDSNGDLSSIGLDFATWTDASDLVSTDGAVFWMAPDNGPSTPAVIAQITVAAGFAGTATMGMQGRSAQAATGGASTDWQADSIAFAIP